MIKINLIWLQAMATLLVSSIIWAQPFSGGPRFPSVLLIIIGLWMLVKDKNSKRDQRYQRFVCIASLLFIPIIFSLTNSYDFAGTIKLAVILPLFILFAAAVFYLLDNYFNARLFYYTLISVCVFWIIDGAVQLAFGQDLFGIPPWSGDGIRIVGPFGERLRLGLFLSITLPLVLFRLKATGMIWQFIYLASALLIIMLTGVRTDLLTTLIAIILYFIAEKKTVFILALVPLLFVVGMLASLNSSVTDSKLKTFSAVPQTFDEWNEASSYRLDIWLTAKDMLLSNPMTGIGAKSFSEAYDDYATDNNFFQSDNVFHAHHPVISIGAETGFIGLIGLFTMLFLLYRWGRQAFGSSLLANPWFQTLVLIFFPIQSMPILFTLWWFPVVTMVILFYLNDIDSQQSMLVK